MKQTLKSTLAVAALALAAAVGRSAPAQAAVGDQAFVTAAGRGGMAEVAQAKLALRASTDPTVDAFARRMIADHTMMNNQLIAIVRAQHLMAPRSIGAKNAAMMSRLAGLRGFAFDKAYLQGQMPAHVMTLRVLQQEARTGSDPQLVAFAKQGIPIVRSHIAMLRRDMSRGTGM